MKKLLSILSTIILCLATTLSTSTIFAEEISLDEVATYQKIADEILDEYGVKEYTGYKILKVPDTTLEEYKQRITELAKMNADGLKSENSISNVPQFKNMNVPSTARVIFLRKTYTETKKYNAYFKICATYDVVTPDGEGGYSWTENARNIYGMTTALANARGFTFTQTSTRAIYNSDHTVTCRAEGSWRQVTAGSPPTVTEYGNAIIEAKFGEQYV